MVFEFLRRLLGRERTGDWNAGDDEAHGGERGEGSTRSEDVLDEIERYLSDFGVGHEGVRQAYEDMLGTGIESGKSTSEYILEHDESLEGDVRRLDDRLGFSILHCILRWSPKGIFSDWKYMEQTAEYQLDSALNGHGYGLEIEDSEGNGIDYVEDPSEEFEIKLLGEGQVEARTGFRYPDTDLGIANYAELMEAINDELLQSTNVEFYQLDSLGDSWSFVLLSDDTYERLTGKHGVPVEAFGQTLLLDEVTDEVQYL